MVRGPYRPQGRKYEAILEGIRAIAREDARRSRLPINAHRYKRADYRDAYAEAYYREVYAGEYFSASNGAA